MYKLKLEKLRSKTTILITLCIFSLVLLVKLVTGQVVIVPNKQRTTRVNNKTKAKTKPKTKKTTASIPTPTPLPRPETPVNAKPLAFAIFSPPSLLDAPPSDPAAGRATPVKLTEYTFSVITSDARGKVTETRKERAQSFMEEISGGAAIEMTQIPGGMFLMGTAVGEIKQIAQEHERSTENGARGKLHYRLRWETPQHAVKLPAFYLGRYEVTQAQWRAVADLPKVKRDLMSDPSYFKGGDRPVEMVSWEDVMEFCERLSRATGRKYRLPTEAEWEYACRAGSASPFHFGAALTPAWANYQGRYPYASAPKGANRQQTIPVGSLGVANAFGLYDMHGNVWEWCLDSWHDNYLSAPQDGRSWDEGGISYLKVIRGGGWDSSAGECRASSRSRITIPFKLSGIGFRVVAEVEEEESR